MRSALLVCLAAASPAGVWGQFTVSIMAGYLHHGEGETFLDDRPIEIRPEDRRQLLDGSTLRTAEGRAEIMLTPGGFLRLGPHSAVEMLRAGLLAADVRLARGSALAELTAAPEEQAIVVRAGEFEVRLEKQGLYRFRGADSAEIAVLDGRAEVVVAERRRKVKSDRRLLVDAEGSVKETSIEGGDDALIAWTVARRAALDRQARAAGPRNADDALGPLYRMWLDMTLRRPSPSPRPPTAPSRGGSENRPSRR